MRSGAVGDAAGEGDGTGPGDGSDVGVGDPDGDGDGDDVTGGIRTPATPSHPVAVNNKAAVQTKTRVTRRELIAASHHSTETF